MLLKRTWYYVYTSGLTKQVTIEIIKKKMGKFESEQTLIKVKNTQFDEFKFHQQTHLS
jgi:hypothetical protein